MPQCHRGFVTDSCDSKDQQHSCTDQGKRDVSSNRFLCYIDRSQHTTDSDNHHQVKDIGTYDVAHRKFIISRKGR